VGKLVNALPFDVKTTFLWFHFVVLILALWVVGLSVALSVNCFAGILAVLLVFGRSYLLTQFHWGVIFDIVGIAVLLPILLLCLHNMNKGIGWKIGVAISLPLFAVFHVNGQYLFALVPVVIAYELVSRLLIRRNYRWGQKMPQYRFMAYLLGMFMALVMAYLLNISIDPTRIFLDASVVLMMFISGVVSLLLVGTRWRYVLGVFIMAIVVSVPQMQYWMQDNSALKNADKQAIAYVNELSSGSYTLSSEITRNIYGLYINQKWVKNGGDYVLVRSVAMTETSAIAVKHKAKVLALDDYRLLEAFNTGEKDRFTNKPIEVLVYVKCE